MTIIDFKQKFLKKKIKRNILFTPRPNFHLNFNKISNENFLQFDFDDNEFEIDSR
jgi:hypothetical protein